MSEYWDRMLDTVTGYLPQLLGALAILIVGWIVALLVSRGVRGVLTKTRLGEKLAGAFQEEGKTPPDLSSGIARGVFWLIMAFVLIAFFQALGLSLAATPLNELVAGVLEYLPLIFGALALLLIAWIVASLLRTLVTRTMRAARVDERIVGENATEPVALTSSVGDAVYWLVFLLFLPAVLGVLQLDGILGPVQGMLDELVGFLPNLLAAALIGLIGWFVARLLRRIVTSLLAATGVDRFGGQGESMRISALVGLVVYILILIPVMIAALNALDLEAITRPASAMLGNILAALPQIFAAAVLIFLAAFVGRVLAGLTVDLLRGIGFDSLPQKLGFGAPDRADTTGTPSRVAGTLVQVIVLALAIFEAADLLGFEVLSSIVAELTVFGGHVLMGVVILSIGLFLANLAARAIRAGGARQAPLLANVARVAILVLTGAIGLRTMGLANEIINLAFGLILGALAVAVAIAFGIGGRHVAARKLEEWSNPDRRA